MKLKDLVSVAKNKSNNQVNFSLKKKEIKRIGISTEKLLDMSIDDQLNKLLFMKGG